MQNYLTNFNVQYLPSRWLVFHYFIFLNKDVMIFYFIEKISLGKPGVKALRDL